VRAAISLALVGGLVLAVALYILYTRLRGPRFVDCYATLVVAEPPSMALGRALAVAERTPHYTYRQVGHDRLELIRADAEPDDRAERPLPRGADAVVDLLVVTATPVATGTEVRVTGRAAPALMRALREALAKAPAPEQAPA
jgi:hypothetical protein